MQKKILIPLPRIDFDPSEVSIPWKILKDQNFEIVFATPDGEMATCDQIMLTGIGLGILKNILCADKNAKEAYSKLIQSTEFQNPIRWEEAKEVDFDGIILPGGHDKGMREYLESNLLQNLIASFFNSNKPVGAICHGVVLVARSKNTNGKSVLYGRKTTSLLKKQELLAWSLTCLWLKNYYRTYPITVEDEVTKNLTSINDFISGPIPIARDSNKTLKNGFVVRDGNYISARWPGDVHLFTNTFIEMFN